MRSLAGLTFMAVALAAGATGTHVELNPVRTHPHASAATGVEHIIVKLRAAAPVSPTVQMRRAQERLAALALRTALNLDTYRTITTDLHVVHVEPRAAGEAPAATLARLRADPDVQYAEIDQQRYVHGVTPNDPLYAQQWYLQVAAPTPGAVDATDAWSTTTGAGSLVIADIDTGVRPDHPDLAGRLLAGYCFISNSFVGNGGNCPGAGAVDPGDWVTQQDVTSSPGGVCSNATPAPSSWHGTRVAGILGAATDNNTGVAGMTWSSQLLPVRALGKCGGFDSDIISGMLWAAGIPVSGAPNNANPARIINLSLGGTGPCPATYQDAIDRITALGVLIVVSAGNEGGPVDAPANCAGVAGVAGLRQAGTKVGYSSLGPQVALASPAGNCGDAFTGDPSACVLGITTTTNLGYHAPDANDYTGDYHCDPTTPINPNCPLANPNQYRTYNIGTSFSAPIVSGIGALMAAVNSNLNSCELISRLQEGSRSFPQTSLDTNPQPPMCHVPTGATDLQGSECICTRDGRTCGAGMANAAGALQAALRPIAAVSLPSSVSAGQSVTFQGGGSAAANAHAIGTYQWSEVSGVPLTINNAATANASVTLPSCGLATVGLTVTDDAGRQDTGDVVISPTSVRTTAPASATGQGACTVAAPSVEVAVCPVSASVQAGAGTEAFAATLAYTTNTTVTWQVNGVPGGDAMVGTISTAGVYTAPRAVPTPATVTVSAVSAADITSSSSVQVAITAPPAGSGGGGGGGAMDWISLLAAGLIGTLRFRALPRPRSWPDECPRPRSAGHARCDGGPSLGHLSGTYPRVPQRA